MVSIVCTLFEGHYHYGVAALANSLYCQGYRGEIYVGYRGTLPSWLTSAIENPTLNWVGSCTLTVAPELNLHFLPLDTDYHLTNYKPDFMLRLWSSLASEAEAIFYFDPDIVVINPWSAFEEWVHYGVALCEDIHSPKSMHHPIREAWRKYFGIAGFKLYFKEAIYANGGFIGVSKTDQSFLTVWQKLQETMAPMIGGLDQSFFETLPSALPFSPFSIPDQDAMNAAVEAWDGAVSFIDKAGMAFSSGSTFMSHAIGTGKPWLRNYLFYMVNGEPPRRVDKDYWAAVSSGPIMTQPASLIWRRQLAIKISSLVGRFYSKNK